MSDQIVFDCDIPLANITDEQIIFQCSAFGKYLMKYKDSIGFIHVYVLLPLCLVGIVINILAACYIARSQYHRSGAIRVFLLSLCVFDSLQLLFTCHKVIPDLCELAVAHQTESEQETPQLCALYYRLLSEPLAHASAVIDTAHMWLIVSLTAHRHWKISHPLHAHIHDTKHKVKMLIIGIVVAACVFRIPMFFEYELHLQNGTFAVGTTQLRHNRLYHDLYHLILTTLFFNLVPFLTLTILNVMILVTLWKARHTVRKDSTNRHREQRAAVAICTIVTLFLAFHSLFMYELFATLRRLDPAPVDKLISTVSTTLSALSSTLNPLIYVAMGTGCRLCQASIVKSWQFFGDKKLNSALLNSQGPASNCNPNHNNNHSFRHQNGGGGPDNDRVVEDNDYHLHTGMRLDTMVTSSDRVRTRTISRETTTRNERASLLRSRTLSADQNRNGKMVVYDGNCLNEKNRQKTPENGQEIVQLHFDRDGEKKMSTTQL